MTASHGYTAAINCTVSVYPSGRAKNGSFYSVLSSFGLKGPIGDSGYFDRYITINALPTFKSVAFEKFLDTPLRQFLIMTRADSYLCYGKKVGFHFSGEHKGLGGFRRL